MKNEDNNRIRCILQKYKYYVILVVIIFICLVMSKNSNSLGSYTVYFNNEKLNLQYNIKLVNDKAYIHTNDLETMFKDNVYYDRISGKYIITTYNSVTRIHKNDKNYILVQDGYVYLNIEKTMELMNYNVIFSKDKIYIMNLSSSEGTVIKNRVEVYDKLSNNVICFLNKGDNIKVYYGTGEQKEKNIVNIEANIDNNRHYGFVLANNISYEEPKMQITNNIDDKKIIVKADNIVKTNTDTRYVDMVTLEMYRIADVNKLVKLDYTNNVTNGIEVFATITNGYKSSNYDSDIITNMLNSEENRSQIIKQIVDNTVKLAGVNLDFASLKSSDKNSFTQFIKELGATIHKSNKKIIVNVPSEKYIDILGIIDWVDYLVIQPYSARSIASKTSGPISSLKYVEDAIKHTLNIGIDPNKVILEVPAYTILWTERYGTVINAEIYNMSLLDDYLKDNGIQPEFDKTNSQNYIDYTKGITTYRMWLEDTYSLSEKAKLAKNYGLAGVSINKSGIEVRNVYKSIVEIFNN